MQLFHAHFYKVSCPKLCVSDRYICNVHYVKPRCHRDRGRPVSRCCRQPQHPRRIRPLRNSIVPYKLNYPVASFLVLGLIGWQLYV